MNKKSIIIMVSGLAASLILLIFVKSQNGRKEPSSLPAQETVQKQENNENDVQLSWEELNGLNDPMKSGEVKSNMNSHSSRQNNSDSKYPSPSFVTTSEDTLIWKKGIYKKIGNVRQPKRNIQDTILVNGKKYVEIK